MMPLAPVPHLCFVRSLKTRNDPCSRDDAIRVAGLSWIAGTEPWPARQWLSPFPFDAHSRMSPLNYTGALARCLSGIRIGYVAPGELIGAHAPEERPRCVQACAISCESR
jgi:hypothetical protein